MVKETVFLHYTQEELDAQYTNLATDADIATLEAVRTRAATCVTQLKPERDLRYGSDPDNRFDLYRADTEPAPAVIFLHGGQWARGDTGEFCAWADAALGHGVSFIDGTFPQIPRVRLPEIIDHATALVRYVRDRADELGIDGARLCLAGHSSGAHLAASVLVRLANADDADGIACCVPVAGPYDLQPLMRSYRRAYLGLSEDECIACSPVRMADKPLPPSLIVTGSEESDEFKRQADILHEAFSQRGEAARLEVAGANHFEVYRGLYEPDSPVWDFITRHLGPQAAHAAE